MIMKKRKEKKEELTLKESLWTSNNQKIQSVLM